MSTKIEWTAGNDGSKGESWNPLRARTADGRVGWHCERVSDGCRNCYASTFNGRKLPNGGTGLDYTRDNRGKVETYLDADVLSKPLRWRNPRRVFVCSMTDLFGEWVTDEQIAAVFGVMAATPQHTYMVLTKRAARMREFMEQDDSVGTWIGASWRAGVAVGDQRWERGPLPNAWIGVSCEDQATADERIPELLATPAAVRWVSAEPLLRPVDLRTIQWPEMSLSKIGLFDALRGGGRNTASPWRIDWVVIGGESGHGARPCHVEWIRSLVRQCRSADVPAFVKQLGARPVESPASRLRHLRGAAAADAVGYLPGAEREALAPLAIVLRSSKGGDPEEWPADLRVREWPECAARGETR